MEHFIIDHFPIIMGGLITLFASSMVFLGWKTSKDK